ncbi:MAG: alpha/beta hydrolase, partial [Proteobacteria bacterium]|nr:alpha/beta hydrolase [Pseudomonadota bacterium]
MPSDDPQFQYFDGQMRASFPALLAQYEAQSAVVAPSGTLDLRYGPHERQRFDFFGAGSGPSGKPLGTLLYFHAGYWQSRDKATFRFIAPAFTRRGYNVALVNYPLCPSVTLAELMDAARASVPRVLDHLASLGQAPGALIAAGHSAGAHLAVELALTRWPELGARAQAVDGVIALSGIYDLVPLVATSINDKLLLDIRTAQAQSPLHRVAPGAAPALFI